MAGGFSMVPPAPWSKDVFSGRAGGRQGSYARQALGGRQSDAGKSREKALGYMKPVWSVGQSGQARIKSGGPGLILGRPPSRNKSLGSVYVSAISPDQLRKTGVCRGTKRCCFHKTLGG